MPGHSKRPDLARVLARVRDRRRDYIHYDFTRKKNDILKTFFDLGQEFDNLSDLYRICVAVPLEFMEVESRLYLLRQPEQVLELICDSQRGMLPRPESAPSSVHCSNEPYETDNAFLVPIFRKGFKHTDVSVQGLPGQLLGTFELFPAEKLSASDRFFFAKYANRIGSNIHHRMLAAQNIRHLKFINNLVIDIEHNVIIPNMHFRYLFRQLEKKLQEMALVEREARALAEQHQASSATSDACPQLVSRIGGLHGELQEYLVEIQKHHANMSLFLESLFRRDHFLKGHLVLRPKKCMVEREIILPQLEHYWGRFKARNIEVTRPADMEAEEIPLIVDMGLLAQVYANFFSNAVKYTEEVEEGDGQRRKRIAYGREMLPGYFGPGKDGVKFNVYTTGRHLTQEERDQVFASGFRRECSKDLPGSGHGLSFIKHVVEIHAGTVGYEPTERGNNFFFILPLPPRQPELPAEDDEGLDDAPPSHVSPA